MNFHFPARTATCAAAHDGSALSVTLCLFATRSLFPAPPEMPPGFGRPVFRPARLTVPRLTTAPRFLSRSACSRRGHYSPLRRKCRRASAGLFSGLRGSLCRGSRRLRASVLSRCAPSATGNCSSLRKKHLAPAAQLLFRLRVSLFPCSRALRASVLGRPLWPPAGGCGHPACIFSLPIWPRPRLPLRRTPRRGPISTVYTARSFML